MKYRGMSPERSQDLARAWEQALASDDDNITMRDVFARIGIESPMRTLYQYLHCAREMTGYEFPRLNRFGPKRGPETTMLFGQKKPFDLCFFTDAHYYPHERYPAHDILLQVLEDHPPKILINGGDALNGGTIGRQPRIGWEPAASPIEEFEAALRYTDEIADAAPKAKKMWVMGNHDIRHESYLSANAPKMEGMPGTTLEELFPRWELGTMAWVNRSDYGNAGRKYKHRWHSGMHAAYNNALRGGVNIATGHTHKMVLYHYSDDNGVRDAIECGTIADPHSPAFFYLEGNPGANWVEGFVYFHHAGPDSFPEFCRLYRRGSKAYARFRGRTYSA